MLVKETLHLKLQEINTVLRTHYLEEKHIGVVEGLSGIALFQFYYAKYMDNDDYANWGEDSLLILMKLINEGYNNPTFSSGLAGAGWVLDHLINVDFIDLESDEILTELDAYIFSTMMEDIKQANFDFLHGALGYAIYFLQRYKTTQNTALKSAYLHKIEVFLDAVEINAKKDKNGVKWLSVIRSGKLNFEGYNLSLSHGIPSILSFLSDLVINTIFIERSTYLIENGLNYLLSLQIPEEKKSTSLFPSWIKDEDNTDIDSRLAWCYGDLGIGLTTLKAAKAISSEHFKESALAILKHSTKRTDKKDTQVKDASLCHGAFGNAQIYTSIYKQTGDKTFLNSATYWIEYGVDLAIHKNGYAGYKQWFGSQEDWVPKCGLLEGVAGIGLSIIDYLSKEQNTWDKCLFIS